jgi:hypothetical protein
MTEIKPLTSEEIRDEDLDHVYREIDDSWRHGCYVYEVYHREEDDTYWGVSYERSGDGEWNGLREGTADVRQVWPVTETITVTKYISTNPKSECEI